MRRLKLEPRVVSPSGSAHVYIAAPNFLVRGKARVDQVVFPGMDLLGYGQTATFYGRRLDGRYRKGPRQELYRLEELPNQLQDLIKRRRFQERNLTPISLPEGFSDQTPAHVLLGEALARSNLHPRNDTGFWLACQLRDE